MNKLILGIISMFLICGCITDTANVNGNQVRTASTTLASSSTTIMATTSTIASTTTSSEPTTTEPTTTTTQTTTTSTTTTTTETTTTTMKPQIRTIPPVKFDVKKCVEDVGYPADGVILIYAQACAKYVSAVNDSANETGLGLTIIPNKPSTIKKTMLMECFYGKNNAKYQECEQLLCPNDGMTIPLNESGADYNSLTRCARGGSLTPTKNISIFFNTEVTKNGTIMCYRDSDCGDNTTTKYCDFVDELTTSTEENICAQPGKSESACLVKKTVETTPCQGTDTCIPAGNEPYCGTQQIN